MQRIVVVGGGFAGFWSAVGAARCLEESGINTEQVEVVLVSRDGYLTIRPRLYEADLEGIRVPLDRPLDSVGVRRMEGTVYNIDLDSRVIKVDQEDEEVELSYDRLVLAAGSHLYRPDVPGLDAHAFSVDTYDEALKLYQHLHELPSQPDVPGRYTVTVIGAGFTGLEVATEMVERVREVAGKSNADAARVVLIERAPYVGPDLGPAPRPFIEQALHDLGVEVRLGTAPARIREEGVELANTGEYIHALTTVWTAGLRASPLTELLPVERDELGRLPTDQVLKVKGLEGVFAAGDVAHAMTDGEHASLMSCQHATPQGKWAGHNAASDLLGEDLLPYRQEAYVTCLDLGAWGALFTNGWERIVKSKGAEAKEMKRSINQERIYPPTSGDKQELFEAGRPTFEPVR